MKIIDNLFDAFSELSLYHGIILALFIIAGIFVLLKPAIESKIKGEAEAEAKKAADQADPEDS